MGKFLAQALTRFEQVFRYGEYVLPLEGLDDVRICAMLNTGNLGFRIAFCGEQDERDVAVIDIAFDLTAEFEAVEFGHHHTGDDQVYTVLIELRQTFTAVFCLDKAIAFGPERSRKEMDQRVV